MKRTPRYSQNRAIAWLIATALQIARRLLRCASAELASSSLENLRPALDRATPGPETTMMAPLKIRTNPRIVLTAQN